MFRKFRRGGHSDDLAQQYIRRYNGKSIIIGREKKEGWDHTKMLLKTEVEQKCNVWFNIKLWL